MKRETWNSKIGVILAVSGSAIGLGNFLRFPGKAVDNGGGAFMIPYFISFLLVGIPMCWAEWAMGRAGGKYGHNSASGIFETLIRKPYAKYFGVLCIIIPLIIYMYYIYIEAWCLGYAWFFLTGILDLGTEPSKYAAFFENFVGMSQNGSIFSKAGLAAIFFLGFSYIVNFILIYRGVQKGIEKFCKIAMPLLMICSIIILVRVLTLGTPDSTLPEQNVLNGLGFMWNPKWIMLKSGKVWMEAAGQIFFSISVGFGLILTYSSYLKKNADVALSGLTACATNEFAEVILAGLMIIPAAFIFLGAAPLENLHGSTLGLGFYTLPVVFGHMGPVAGRIFGFLFFFLLFLAAITSSISMLQPAIAFIEQGFGVTRRAATVALGFITGIGALAVIYLTKNLAALDIMDFWAGTAFIFIMATLMVIFFGWFFGAEKGVREVNRGAAIKVPAIFAFILKYVTPLYLITIFLLWIKTSAGDYIKKSFKNPDVIVTMAGMGLLIIFVTLMVNLAGKRWNKYGIGLKEVDE
ncbi:MAG: sodium-dependent transporter [bacterium]